jgi:hypothetical protein
MQSFFLDPFRRCSTEPGWIDKVRFKNFSQHLARALDLR